LKNKIFDKIRRPNLEKSSKVKVQCDFDDDLVISDSYEQFKKDLRSKDQDKLDFFKRKIMHELLKLNL
jgi:hypothetical protein